MKIVYSLLFLFLSLASLSTNVDKAILTISDTKTGGVFQVTVERHCTPLQLKIKVADQIKRNPAYFELFVGGRDLEKFQTIGEIGNEVSIIYTLKLMKPNFTGLSKYENLNEDLKPIPGHIKAQNVYRPMYRINVAKDRASIAAFPHWDKLSDKTYYPDDEFITMAQDNILQPLRSQIFHTSRPLDFMIEALALLEEKGYKIFPEGKLDPKLILEKTLCYLDRNCLTLAVDDMAKGPNGRDTSVWLLDRKNFVAHLSYIISHALALAIHAGDQDKMRHERFFGEELPRIETAFNNYWQAVETIEQRNQKYKDYHKPVSFTISYDEKDYELEVGSGSEIADLKMQLDWEIKQKAFSNVSPDNVDSKFDLYVVNVRGEEQSLNSCKDHNYRTITDDSSISSLNDIVAYFTLRAKRAN